MSDPFTGEVRIFAGTFAPRNWAFCDGQLLPTGQNSALFSLLGHTYGAGGRRNSNFGLPNFQGRAPKHPGSGPGLSPCRLGETRGYETVTLTYEQMPSHTHLVRADGIDRSPAESNNPTGNILGTTRGVNYKDSSTNDDWTSIMADAALSSAGGGQPHNNMQPFLTLNFIIALDGTYPSRS